VKQTLQIRALQPHGAARTTNPRVERPQRRADSLNDLPHAGGFEKFNLLAGNDGEAQRTFAVVVDDDARIELRRKGLVTQVRRHDALQLQGKACRLAGSTPRRRQHQRLQHTVVGKHHHACPEASQVLRRSEVERRLLAVAARRQVDTLHLGRMHGVFLGTPEWSERDPQ
jgi:hypothetical protein